MRASWLWQAAVSALIIPLSGCILFIDQNVCGDGDIDSFEECDEGGANSDTTPNACRTDCTLPFCGDGVIDSFEECDGGANCDAFCNLVGNDVCGDGFTTGAEECDDGGNADFDGCDAFCQNEATGSILFDYVLIESDGAGGFQAASACTITIAGVPTTVADVHFMLGDSVNGDGILDNNEILQESTIPCNQEDANGNGVIENGELGLFSDDYFAGNFDLFAIEFLDSAGFPILWETFDTTTDAERFTFGAGVGITVSANQSFVIPFAGDPNLLAQLDQELQAFFGF